MGARYLYEIAADVRRNWANVNYAAEPYLRAMATLKDMGGNYGMDDAKSIVLYFLSNATSWRGEHARRIKKELKDMLGGTQ